MNHETFTSERKRVTTVVEKDGQKYLFVKGASELIVDASDKLLKLQTGQITALDPAMRQTLSQVIGDFNRQSLRTVAFAYRKLNEFHPERKSEKGVFEDE